MSLYILAGPLLNHLTRTALAPQWSPADDTVFPGTNACDGRSDIPAYWSSSTSDPSITVDLSLIGDPGFETSTTAWTLSSTDLTFTSSSGMPDQDLGAGYYSYRTGGLLVSSAGTDYAYADVSVRSGESMRISWALCATATTCGATVSVQNLETGKYLSSGSTWSDSALTLVICATTSETVTSSVSFAVESPQISYVDVATLRVMLAASTGGSVYFDDIVLIPETNFCSIHGHNWTPALTPILQSHADPGYWITQSTMTLRRDSFYSVLSSGVLARYWRLKLSGTPAETPYVGEVVLGSATESAERPLYGGQLEEVEAQVRLTTADGGLWIDPRGAAPLRKVSFEFTYTSSSAYEEARDEFFRGCRGGVNPCVVAPADMDSSLVVFGTVAERTTYVKVDYVTRSGGWDVTESPLPNITYEP